MNTPHIRIETLREDRARALHIGARVFFNFEAGQVRPAHSRMFGWAADRFLLLAEPPAHEVALEYRPGAPWVLKYVASGYVCAADTAYLERTSTDLGGVFVTFPDAIHIHSLRLHRRIDVTIPVQYLYPNPDGSLPEQMERTTLCDLSLGGCAIWVTETVELETRLCVALAPDPAVDPAMIVGTVRRCIPGLGGHTIGIEFDPVDTEQHATLATMLGGDADLPDVLAEDQG